MKCPRAKSEMTPCYVKDGELAVAIATEGWGSRARRICVGCEHGTGMLREERAMVTSQERSTP
jgi:hypothetical protein